MAVFQIILLVVVFLIMALAMFFRKIPALLALPLMAFLIPLIGGVEFRDVIQLVLGQGAVKLHTAYTVAIFGSMLSILLQKTGVAENLIKKGAELSGDNPWIIAVIMLFLIALLFTTLGGLGAIIMVATIVLPILTSVGIGSMTVVGIFLIGLSMGGILNAGNWAVYVDVLQLSVNQIRPFALIMFFLTFLMSIVYITIQIYRDGHDINFKRIAVYAVSIFFMLGLIFYSYSASGPGFKAAIADVFIVAGYIFELVVSALMILLLILSIIHTVKNSNKKSNDVYWTAYFTPVIPLILILLYDVNFIAAFICGLLYGYIATYKKGSLNVLIQSILEGGAVVMPAVALMIGIGMLLVAVIGPGDNLAVLYPQGWPVLNLLKPVLMKIVPDSLISFVIIFSFMAPLALYRGPLNVWGMGYGLAAVFLASGMAPGAIMGLLIAVGQVQGVSDPTNTHNVWLANEMQLDVQKVLWNTLPYTWIVAFLGLVVAGFMFY